MRLSYDPRPERRLHPLPHGRGRSRTVRISDEINIDLAPGGTVAGIELLNANEQLRASDGDQLVVTDETDGREIAVPLTAAWRALQQPPQALGRLGQLA